VSGIRVERVFDQTLPAISPEAELAIYRIAQESLTNVARHARAERLRISLAGGPDSVVLRVIDDGRGFEGGLPPDEQGGLRSMRERALLIGAALAIKQASPAGLEVRLEVPATRIAEPVQVHV
jgi:two-component system sensor histidine kinase UhpB